MRLFVVAIAVVSFAVLAGCDTVGDIRYVAGSKAEQENNYGIAFSQFLELARDDSYHDQVSAQVRVSEYFFKGQGTPKNNAQGLYWLKQAANSTDPRAKTWIGIARNKLGWLYETGIPGFLEVDEVTAAQWYQKAARVGAETAPEALERLSEYPEIYISVFPERFAPNGRPKPGELDEIEHLMALKPSKAFAIADWYARAGSPEAQLIAAQFHMQGIGVKVDRAEGARWLYLSAKNGLAESQYRLAVEFYHGKSVPIDFERMEQWMRRAAEQDHSDALNDLGTVYSNPLKDGAVPNYASARHLFERAAALGNLNALVNLGDLYRAGLGVRKNPEVALRYYEKAAAAGDEKAKEKMAVMAAKNEAIPVGNKTVVREIEKPVHAPGAEKVFDLVSRSVFKIYIIGAEDVDGKVKYTEEGNGSGVAVTKRLALTNCHVVEGDWYFAIAIGEEVGTLTVVRRFEDDDICIVKSDDLDLTPVGRTRPIDDLRIGESVFAIGSPQGLENTISQGIISGFRKLKGKAVIQTSAPITFGSSGGGLFDADGALIGITRAGLEGKGSLNFAVPAFQFVNVAKKL